MSAVPTPIFTKVILDRAPDGRSRFREEQLSLSEVKPLLFLSNVFPSGGVQLRVSPPGYAMDVHPTTNPQWMFVLSGAIEIGLPDGTSRVFRAGDHLFSQDTTPAGVPFDPKVHGHWTRQVGDEPIVAAFARG